MGIFAKANEKVTKNIENANAPESFKDCIKVDSEIVQKLEFITIDSIILRTRYKYEKDKDGNNIKDENGNFVIKTDFKQNPVYGYVAFVKYDGSNYFVTKSPHIINQLSVMSDNVNLKAIGDYEIEGVSGSKVRIVDKPLKLSNGKEYEYPIFIDVE